MTARTIRNVTGAEPRREGETPDCFWVGYGTPVVTRIEEEMENLGSYGITWFVAYDKNGNAIGKMNATHVASVHYEVTP